MDNDFTAPPASVLVGRTYHPVIHLPDKYDVYDFTANYDPHRVRREYGIGRYNEHRPNMYAHSLFQDQEEPRTVHMGVDIGAPARTPIFSFMEGVLIDQRIHPQEGDYGPTLVTEHQIEKELKLYALWGHLSKDSLLVRRIGDRFESGEVLGHVGQKTENGGWNPHLHFQLSWTRPVQGNLPGVVKLSDRELALKHYPDPLLILGPLY